jgi:hypothetical protein
VEIDLIRKIVTLPKQCQWYPGDFASRRHGQINAHSHAHLGQQNGVHGTQGTGSQGGTAGPSVSTPNNNPSHPNMGPVASPVDCLKVIVHYLKKEEKEKILRLLFDIHPPIIKFKKFNYRCRTIISEKECSKKLAYNGSFAALQDGMQGLSSEEKEMSSSL